MDDDPNATGTDGGTASAPAEIAAGQAWASAAIIHQNESFTLLAQCCNIGGSPTGEFKVKFDLDGEAEEISIPSLNPGECHTDQWEHGAVGPGDHVFQAIYDSEGQVQETSKDNNNGYYGFQVLDTDA